MMLSSLDDLTLWYIRSDVAIVEGGQIIVYGGGGGGGGGGGVPPASAFLAAFGFGLGLTFPPVIHLANPPGAPGRTTFYGAGGGGGGAGTSTTATGGSSSGGGGGGGAGSGSLGFSGIGHICMLTDQSGSTTVSQTCGRIMSPLGPTRS